MTALHFEPGELPPDVAVLCVDDTRRALADMARAWRRTLDTVTVIAVTGSVGKTTTKNLIHAALGASPPVDRIGRTAGTSMGDEHEATAGQDSSSTRPAKCSSASGLARASRFLTGRPCKTSRTASSTILPLRVRGISGT